MNNETTDDAGRTMDRCGHGQEPNDDGTDNESEKGYISKNHLETAVKANKTSPEAATGAEPMDDTSSSTSEEVMSGAQSDQTANISSNGGYSGDYESISDSSSIPVRHAEAARKSRDDSANAIGGESGRRHRVKDEEKEEKTEHEIEKGRMKLSLSRPSSLAHMNASESEDGTMSVDYGRHHHHRHHQIEVVGTHDTMGNNSNSHHHHYHHHTNRPNKPTSRQVNRQIDQIMNLYNVSLQAQAKSQVAMSGDNANGSDEVHAIAAAIEGDANPNDIRIQRPRVHYPYQVESKGSLSGDRSQPPRRSSNGLLSSNNNGPPNDFRGSVQLGGVRIMDASDPRIDAKKLYQTQSATSGYGRPKEDSARAKSNEETNDNKNDTLCTYDNNVEDCYTNLMEACRPFFQDTQTIMASKKIPLFRTAGTNQSQVGSDEAQSSSGFTSFFTTTKSESNTNGCGSGGSSQSEFSHQNKKRKIEEKEENEDLKESASLLQRDHPTKPNHDAEKAGHHEQQEYQHQGATLTPTRSCSFSHIEAYQSDSSSMVVLARVKRKHKDQIRHVVNGSPISANTAKAVCAVSSSTSDCRPPAIASATAQQERRDPGAEEYISKRVRIEKVALDAAKYRSSRPSHPSTNKQPESSSLTSSLSTSVDSSGSDGGEGAQAKRNDVAHSAPGTSGEDRSKADSQSGSGENSNNQAARTVTDTSGTTTANNSSGSGNDNDATNKSESGSQMEGNSNSDDKVCGYYKKDSVASDTNTVTSVAAVNGDVKKRADSLQEPDKPLIHHHNHGGKKSAVVDVSGPDKELQPILDDSPQANMNNNLITKEEKLIEKKRKRMSARKEYEEEWQRQMRDSSESSSRNDTTTLEPGKPVTLEDVLSFTKTARLLVQALPPFLAVHANAAFTQLTGINSHIVIGQPVSSIIAIAEGLPPNKESDSSGSDMTNNKDTMSSLSGSLEGNEGQNDVNIVDANDPTRQDQQEPANNGNISINAQDASASAGFRIDRLIVARGYGHIHNVEVIFAPPQGTGHAIEGSEVKINEGNANAKRKKKDDKIFCRMSVSPVVTSIESWDNSRIEGHTDLKAHPHSSSSGVKRRKHVHMANERMIVKHYLIQLESIDGPHLLDKRSSFSSSTDTTVEAQHLGITRSELVARRCRLERSQRDAPEVAARPLSDGGNLPETDSQDENASVVEPVATCG